MKQKRTVEILSAGCPVCSETVSLVRGLACLSCEVTVLDMNEPEVAERARSLGISSIPAVLVDGKLADCCRDRGPDETGLRAAGIGRPL